MSMRVHKIFILLFMLLVTLASHASYLYWRVNESDISASGIDAEYVRVVAYKSESEKTVLDASKISDMPDEGTYVSLDSLGDATKYSFYVELVNYISEPESYPVVGVSNTKMSYADMVASKYIDTGTEPITPVAIWHGGTIVVPEPTTGMLVMFGFGLLALKRREKVGPPKCRREIS